MKKVVDQQQFKTKSSEGTILELSSGEILLGFTGGYHLPKITTTHFIDDGKIDVLKGTSYVITHDVNLIRVAVYE